MASLLRKKQERFIGLKVLIYGESGSGKSVYALGWDKLAYLDSENKLGVYESNENFNKNLVGICDSSSYVDTMALLQEIQKDSSMCSTFVIDSETMVYKNLQLSALETEEARYVKKGLNVDDATLSMRSWGRIKYLNERFTLAKSQLSANGINVITVAQKEDITQTVGSSERVKVGEKFVLGKNAEFMYDVILRFYKERDIATGNYKYMAEVEKDTTNTFKLGDRIANPTYENTFKSYVDKNKGNTIISTNYATSLDDTMKSMNEEMEDFDSVVEKFETLFKQLKDKDANNTVKVKEILNKHGVGSYKKIEFFSQLKEVVRELEQLK